jgi:hypothetical protein
MNANVRPTHRLLTLKQVVDVFGATLWFWRERIWRGELPVVRAGRKQFIDVKDVEDFIQKQKQEGRHG